MNFVKKFAYETWYSNSIVNVDGIWLGNGVFEQSIIKMNDFDNRYRTQISDDYAWVFKNGNSDLIKIINDDGDKNE